MKALIITAGENEFTEHIARLVKENFNPAEFSADVVNLPDKIQPCLHCGKCAKSLRCVFDDEVNRISEAIDQYAGVIMILSTCYDGFDENTTAFLDRLFNSAAVRLSHKAASVLLISRHASTRRAYAELMSFLAKAEMVVLTDAHYGSVDTADKTKILVKIRRTAVNMSWLMRALNRDNTHVPDKAERLTDFIR